MEENRNTLIEGHLAIALRNVPAVHTGERQSPQPWAGDTGCLHGKK